MSAFISETKRKLIVEFAYAMSRLQILLNLNAVNGITVLCNQPKIA